MKLKSHFSGQKLRRALLTIVGVMLATNAFAGRVPTKYNDRYQTMYVEQELFRKRPELLACVNSAKEFVQANNNSLFNKLRFTPKSVQTGYMVDGVQNGVAFEKTVIKAEGRIRAYSLFENWELAIITCDQPLGGEPKITLEMGN